MIFILLFNDSFLNKTEGESRYCTKIWIRHYSDPQNCKIFKIEEKYLNVEGVPFPEADVLLLVDEDLLHLLQALHVRLEGLLPPLVLALHLLVHLLKLFRVL